MANILITGGPTNEYIDEVMKITNMSTGKLAIGLAYNFLDLGHKVTLIGCIQDIKNSVRNKLFVEFADRFTPIFIETTDELKIALEHESHKTYDIVIHSAAVGDYKPEFSFKLEELAEELYDFFKIKEQITENDILNILKNPQCKVNDSSKISSCENNLTVKLEMTPKLIYHLRNWFPDAKIAGFKLLDNVHIKELISAAETSVVINELDVVFANDLSELRKGNKTRLGIVRNNQKIDVVTILDTKDMTHFMLNLLEDEYEN